jgi:hypothetical protein
MSTMQQNAETVKPVKAETTADLTPAERALCDRAAQQALGRLFASYRALPGWPICPRGEAFRAAETAMEEARSRVLAERDAPEDTVKDALYAAELARQATEAAQWEAREAEEREGVYDDLHEPGGPESDDDYRVWE